MRIGGHTLQSEEQGGAKRYDIVCTIPQRDNRNRCGTDAFPLRNDTMDKIPDRIVIKIHIGQGCEKSVDDQTAGFGREILLLRSCLSQLDQLAYELVLQIRGFWLFAADTGCHTGFVACGLLTLKTKHF